MVCNVAELGISSRIQKLLNAGLAACRRISLNAKEALFFFCLMSTIIHKLKFCELFSHNLNNVVKLYSNHFFLNYFIKCVNKVELKVFCGHLPLANTVCETDTYKYQLQEIH